MYRSRPGCLFGRSPNMGGGPKMSENRVFTPILGPEKWCFRTRFRGPASSFPRCPVSMGIWSVLKIGPRIVHLGPQNGSKNDEF